MKLVDTRYKGRAVGVGSCEIIGRIHALKVKINKDVEITVTVQILAAQNMQFLFGLDNMKRHRCCVDLIENHLKFNELMVSCPFLKEHEIGSEYLLTKSHSEISDNPTLIKSQSMTQEDKVKEFMALSNLDYDDAKKILETHYWDMEMATQAMFKGSRFGV